jgi:hypothetical protein
MTNVTMKLEQSQPQTDAAVHLFDNWFDPIEAGLRDRVREFIHAMVEGELDMALFSLLRPVKAKISWDGGRPVATRVREAQRLFRCRSGCKKRCS